MDILWGTVREAPVTIAYRKKEFIVQMIDELKNEKQRYNRLLGKLSYQKGYHAEFLILNRLLYHAVKDNEILKSVTRYLPDDFDFCAYSRVWKYHGSPEYAKVFTVDIFARSLDSVDYSIIGEVKNREIINLVPCFPPGFVGEYRTG